MFTARQMTFDMISFTPGYNAMHDFIVGKKKS